MQKNKQDESRISVFFISFCLLVLFCIFSIINTIRLNPYRADIKYSESVLEQAAVNFTFKNKIKLNNSFLICFNDSCRTPDYDFFYNVYNLKYNPQDFGLDFYSKKLNNIYFIYDNKNAKEIEDNFDDIYLYVGNSFYYYTSKDIKQFKKDEIKIKLDETNEEASYRALVLPKDYKTNYKGVLNHCLSLFLNFFYNARMFIIPYFWLFVAFCIFAYKKEEIYSSFNKIINRIKTRINKAIDTNKIAKFSSVNFHYLTLGIIILLGFLLRFNLLDYSPFWYDELYTKLSAIVSFRTCFEDPGNPPLFFILEFLMSKINSSDYALRLVPAIIGGLVVVAFYFLFRNINKNLALFASFFAAINTVFIYHSKEIRSSILCALLIVLTINILFKYLNKPNNKNLIVYSFLSICLVNTHYYLALFVFSNFIWAIVDLFSNKNIENKKNKILKFILANSIIALSFLPYLLISFKQAINGQFNSWIGEFNSLKFLYAINEYFTNKYIFLFLAIVVLINLIVIYLPNNVKNLLDKKLNLQINPKKENLYIYLVYSITLLLILISLISIFIKPIFHKRLLLSIYCLLVLLEILSISTVFDYRKLEKLPLILKGAYSTILFFFCMYITHPMPLNKICKVDDYMNFIRLDSAKYISQGYEIHGFLIDSKKCLKKYPDVKKLDIKWHVIEGNKGEYIRKINKDKYVDKNKKAVLYLSTMGVDFDALAYNPYAYVIYTNAVVNAKIIYDN